MSFLPNFDFDVFISYSHRDNLDRWINRFHQELQKRLNSYVGEEVTTWLDSESPGASDEIPSMTEAALSKSAILVVVLTPSYLRSKWCNRELMKFLDALSVRDASWIKPYAPIFKVIKTPLPQDVPLPSSLQNTLGIELYKTSGSRPLELNPTTAGFIHKIDDLAQDIANVLRLHKIQEVNQGGQEQSSIPTNAANATAIGTVEKSSIFKQLSLSAKIVLSRADGMRKAMGQNRVHMEHLIAGLLEKSGSTTDWLFRVTGINRTSLVEIVRATVKTELPSKYSTQTLAALPPVSKHVEEAILAASNLAREYADTTIHSRYLLYGALSIENCSVIAELLSRGVRKEHILQDGSSVTPIPSTGQPHRAYPTPKIVSDRWAEQDTLGYQAYARTLGGIITNIETVPPLTIGIKAPWGAGKTSLMKQVQYLLDGDAAITEENEAATRNRKQTGKLSLSEMLRHLGSVITLKPLQPKASEIGASCGIPARVTVWFNAWKYQTSEQIWAGLAHCIISQVAARMDTHDRELFWLKLHARRISKEAVRKKLYELLLRHLIPLAFLFLAAMALTIWWVNPISNMLIPVLGIKLWWAELAVPGVGIIGLVWKARQKLAEKAADVFKELVREPDYEGKMGFLYLVESDIRDVLDLVARKEAPLVIFVDDLDRCVPRKVAEVVEAINLSLSGDYPNCIFVLGMEPAMVAAALEVANKEVIATAKQLSLVDSGVPLGWRFMEKIVQLPVIIPPPTGTGIQLYMDSLIGPQATSRNGSKTFSIITAAAPKEDEVKKWMENFTNAKNIADVVNTTDRLLAQSAPEEKLALAEASKRKYAEKFSDRDPVVSRFVGVVLGLVDGNPRQLKRYINVFRFYSTLRHNFRVDSAAQSLKVVLPSDEALAKYIALCIQWPHAADCLRVIRRVNGDEKKPRMSLLGVLEQKSKTIEPDTPEGDAEWLEFLKDEGLTDGAFGGWVSTRSFRKFLADGESLAQLEQCGLW